MTKNDLTESVAIAIAEAQNVPFVGAKQRKLAVVAIAAMESYQEERAFAARQLRDIGLQLDGA